MLSNLYVEEISGHHTRFKRSRLWFAAIDYFESEIKYLELNYAYDTEQAIRFLEDFQYLRVRERHRGPRLYRDDSPVVFRIDDKLYQIVRSMSYDRWLYLGLEDPSLTNGETEFVAALTHHNMLGVRLTEYNKEHFQKLGFKLDCIWQEESLK